MLNYSVAELRIMYKTVENMTLWTCTGKQKVFFLKSYAAFSDTYSLNSYENFENIKKIFKFAIV